MDKPFVRINAYTRDIEYYYQSITQLSDQYERKKVLDCLNGKTVAYGGIYSDTGNIWRWVNDIPYLTPQFDFNPIQGIILPSKINYKEGLLLSLDVDMYREMYMKNYSRKFHLSTVLKMDSNCKFKNNDPRIR